MIVLFSLLWLLCLYAFIMLLITPSVLWFEVLAAGGALENVWLFVSLLPLTLLLGVFLVLLTVRGFYYCIPPAPEGRFEMFSDKGAVLWAINNAPAMIVLKWFQSTLFLNDLLRYLILKALDCRVDYTTWITSNTHLSDLRNIQIGKDTMLGESCWLMPSVQVRRNRLHIANIDIGNNVMLGTGCRIGPGVHLADQVSLDLNVTIHGFTSIGFNTQIGAYSQIYQGCKIGNHVVIGKNCTIKSRANIESGAVIPDATIVSDRWPTKDENLSNKNECTNQTALSL